MAKKQKHPTPRDSEHNKDLPDFWRRNLDYGESPYMHIDCIEKITDRPRRRKRKRKSQDIIESLVKIADHLDEIGLHDEATELDNILEVVAKKEKAPKKPPKKYREGGATSKSDYADPENYKYPIDTEAHVRSAISYFSKPANADKYSKSKQQSIWARIRSAAKKYKIEMSEKSGPPSVEKNLSSVGAKL